LFLDLRQSLKDKMDNVTILIRIKGLTKSISIVLDIFNRWLVLFAINIRVDTTS